MIILQQRRQQNSIFISKNHVSEKTVWQQLHKSKIHGTAAIAKPLITENNTKRQKHGMMVIKPGCLMIGNTYGQMSGLSRCFQHQAGFMSGECPRKRIFLNAGSNCETWKWPVMIWAAVSQCSASPIITRNGRITASSYVGIFGEQVHPTIQMLFPTNDAIFQDDICPYTQP
jgi:hypothetical protein